LSALAPLLEAEQDGADPPQRGPGSSGSAQLSLINDQYALWRTARAIAVALYLLVFEVMLLAAKESMSLTLNAILSNDPTGVSIAILKVYFFPFCFAIVGLGVTILFIRGTYSRLCFTLFSLMYVACNKQIVSRKDEEPAP
jgi:hypothetical protein